MAASYPRAIRSIRAIWSFRSHGSSIIPQCSDLLTWSSVDWVFSKSAGNRSWFENSNFQMPSQLTCLGIWRPQRFANPPYCNVRSFPKPGQSFSSFLPQSCSPSCKNDTKVKAAYWNIIEPYWLLNLLVVSGIYGDLTLRSFLSGFLRNAAALLCFFKSVIICFSF